MLVKVRDSTAPENSEIATESIYHSRREIAQSLALGAAALTTAGNAAPKSMPSWLEAAVLGKRGSTP